VGKFRTRLPVDKDGVECPCGSGMSYAACCEPFHAGRKRCLVPRDVLRTRYSAFTYRLVKYIMDTAHPSCRDYREDKTAWAQELNKNGMFDSYDFMGLEIGGATMAEDEDEAYLDFKVRLRAKDRVGQVSSLVGKETVISERSKFLRDEIGVWSYASGDVRSDDISGLEDVVLNRSTSK